MCMHTSHCIMHRHVLLACTASAGSDEPKVVSGRRKSKQDTSTSQVAQWKFLSHAQGSVFNTGSNLSLCGVIGSISCESPSEIPGAPLCTAELLLSRVQIEHPA